MDAPNIIEAKILVEPLHECFQAGLLAEIPIGLGESDVATCIPQRHKWVKRRDWDYRMECGACRQCNECDRRFHNLDVLQYLHNMCIQHIATMVGDIAGNADRIAAASRYANLIVENMHLELSHVYGQD